METNEIVKALNRLKVETGSLVCLGCGHEHNCGVHGCAILRETVGLLEKQERQIQTLKAALSAMEQDLQRAVSTSWYGCVLCAHFCNDGKPVYRPDEGYLAYCEKCGVDCCCFEWRGIVGTIPEEKKHGEIRKS